MEVINNPTLEDVLTLAQKLSSVERLRLIERVATTLEPELKQTQVQVDKIEEANKVSQNLEITDATIPTITSSSVLTSVEDDSKTTPNTTGPNRLLYGMLAHLGPGPTDEDIDEMRREALSNFPREEFYD